MPWLMALDLPQPVGLPPDVTLNHDGELLSRKPVNERIRYTLISNPQYVLAPQLDAPARTRLTRLPQAPAPHPIALAHGWKVPGHPAPARSNEPPPGLECARPCCSRLSYVHYKKKHS